MPQGLLFDVGCEPARRRCCHCARAIDRDRRTCGLCCRDTGPAACLICERRVLVKPGTCYACSVDLGFDPNSDGKPSNLAGGQLTLDCPERERRVTYYESRAAAGLPLFAGRAG